MPQPVTLVHLSDLHVQVGGDTAKNLESISWALARHYRGQSPKILITGDISNNGQKDELELARNSMQPLYEAGFEIFSVPGNHDYGPLGNIVWRSDDSEFRAVMGEIPSWGTPSSQEHVLIGLNTMAGQSASLDRLWADGDLGDAQLNKLAEALTMTPRQNGQRVVVFMHHHPYAIPTSFLPSWVEKPFFGMDHAKRFQQIIRGKIDVLLLGHQHHHADLSHFPQSKELEIPYIFACGPSTTPSQRYSLGKRGHAVKMHEAKLLLGREITLHTDGRVSWHDLNLKEPAEILPPVPVD